MIMRMYNQKQLEHKREQDARIADAYQRIPRLAEIDQEIASVSLKKAREMLTGSKISNWNLSEAIQELAEERTCLLAIHKLPPDYLELHYDCPVCQDTGYVNNEKCICFKKAEIDLLYTQSNIKEILKTENFNTFRFDYYSDQLTDPRTGLTAMQTARIAVEKARLFIENFFTSFENLFLYGETGVGKTFLTHCIARELIDQTCCVIYFTASDFFDLLAKHTFSSSEDYSELYSHISDCDLLIIDDLGTEMTNTFTSSQLFVCLNERILRKKSTIISTNLSMAQFKDIYSERTFSRISSSYTMIKLFGNDIRIQKKLSGGNLS